MWQYEQTSDSQLVEVSNIISSNKVQAPAVSSVPCNEPKMEICKPDKVVSQKSNEIVIPMQQGVPGITALLKGCNFSNCNVTFTGSSISTKESKGKQASSSYQATELMEGISLEEFFTD